jgi:hypothetical protein
MGNTQNINPFLLQNRTLFGISELLKLFAEYFLEVIVNIEYIVQFHADSEEISQRATFQLSKICLLSNNH